MVEKKCPIRMTLPVPVMGGGEKMSLPALFGVVYTCLIIINDYYGKYRHSGVGKNKNKGQEKKKEEFISFFLWKDNEHDSNIFSLFR